MVNFIAAFEQVNVDWVYYLTLVYLILLKYFFPLRPFGYTNVMYKTVYIVIYIIYIYIYIKISL